VSIDPRTPVIAAVGQSLHRPSSSGAIVEPIDLMVGALEQAATSSGGGRALLESIDRLSSIASFVWHTTNPSLLVTERLGLSVDDLVLTATGGATPEKLVADACAAISAGEREVVAFVGAEAMASKAAAKKDPWLGTGRFFVQDPETTPAPRAFGVDALPLTELEMARGVLQPVSIYPLFENARRQPLGIDLATQRQGLGDLWAGFADVAASNPYAWITDAPDATTILTPTTANRMIAEPYTKMMVANITVDQGAAVIVTSLEKARQLGISDDLLVFPWCHTRGDDPWYVSDRPDLGRSPALELIAAEILALGGVGIDDIAHIDLYSCFPVAVELAAEALGLDPLRPGRQLTLTGGLTFAGGPGNNYVTHSLATMVETLQADPGALGLVSGLSYFATNHAMGIYSTTPPRVPYRATSVQEALDVLPTQPVADHLEGSLVVETFTIAHDRQGPSLGTFAVRDTSGTRSWATIADRSALDDLSGTDLVGRACTMAPDGALSLR
jgi:acetyl-CoA C-acetyltransferase